jgi:hypothetical protein
LSSVHVTTLTPATELQAHGVSKTPQGPAVLSSTGHWKDLEGATGQGGGGVQREAWVKVGAGFLGLRLRMARRWGKG